MAIHCTQCGTTLKDDARFCNICGTLVPSHPFSPKSSVSAPSPDSTIIRRDMREHIPYQPPARPIRHLIQDEQPSWSDQITSEAQPGTSSTGLERERQKSFPLGAQGDDLPKQRDFNTSPGSQPDTSEQEEKTQIVSPARALHAKVWEQNQNHSTAQNGQHSRIPFAQQQQGDNDEVEALPTRPLVAETPTIVKSQPTSTITTTPSSLPTASSNAQKPSLSSVDQLDTVPIAIPGSIKPKIASIPVAEPVQSLHQLEQRPGNFNDQQAVQPPSSISQLPYQRATGLTVQDPRPSFPGAPIPATPIPDARKMASPSVSPVRRPKQRKSRKPLALTLVILLLLIVGGGIGAWIVLEQPFTMAGVAQSQQTFSNTRIGISLSYPNGWIARIDTTKMTVLLSDSSQTAQFNVVSSAANSADVGKFLQQEASQQGMTGLKPILTQSFAGTSWQQLQGSVLLNGASYTEILLATTHGQKMYTITELAPQSTYSQEEQYAFSGMRSSFQFIA